MMKKEQAQTQTTSTKRNVLVTSLVVGVAFTVMTAWMLVRSADRSEQTIKTSNNRVLYLGQSGTQALQIMGASLRAVNGVPNQYKFVPGDKGIVEAVVLMSNNRITGIRLLDNENNVQVGINAKVGGRVSAINPRVRSRLQQIPAGTVKTSLNGYTLTANDGSIVYYLTDPCRSDDQIIKIVMAENGHQEEALGRVINVDCDGGDG
jgi:hypothetical protein